MTDEVDRIVRLDRWRLTLQTCPVLGRLRHALLVRDLASADGLLDELETLIRTF
tara:strand:- start:720 stop:881 length:162 start_codon:yes stop_codon:yes gene_type:complete